MKKLLNYLFPYLMIRMADEGGGGGDDYLNSVPEEYREVPSIKEAGSMDNLFKGYVNLETKMGTAVFKPGEDADDAQMDDFYNKVNDLAPGLTRIPTSDEDEKGWGSLYNKLGRPDDATAYESPEIKINDKDSLDQSEYADAFKEHAHKIGMSTKQYAQTMEWIGSRTVERMGAGAEARESAMTELKKEWGDATDARTARTQKLIEEYGSPEVVAALGKAGNDPFVLKMFDKMADSLMEEGSLGKQGGNLDADTRSQINEKIATLKANDAYLNRKNPDHDRVTGEVNRLYEKLEHYKAA